MKLNALRGRPLKGVELELPKDYSGIVLRENEKLKKDDDERELKFSGKFNKFMYWNYDKNPSVNDSYQKALNWLNIADSVSYNLRNLPVFDSDDYCLSYFFFSYIPRSSRLISCILQLNIRLTMVMK